jgi:methylmalonyl-CoA mutase
MSEESFRLKNAVRIVTAASLFDGHDAAINIMRRILQANGAEVIHLGHNRSAQEIVECAIEEDVQGIAVTSYQGGHVEYFKYIHDLLKERGANIKVFGGGGGTILPAEIAELHAYGITRIYSPDDGRSMGLVGMIRDLLERCDFPTVKTVSSEIADLANANASSKHRAIGRLISLVENVPQVGETLAALLPKGDKVVPVLGVTGTGGSGKSSLIDELVLRFLRDFSDKRVAIVSIDPTKKKSGGGLLGDRIRMNAIDNARVYMRSLATRRENVAMSRHAKDAVAICKAAGFDLVIVETSGIGQSDTEIVEHCDVSLYVMTSEYGAATQLEKIDMLDYAHLVAINKFEKRGSLDALRDVKKQWKRSREAFTLPDDQVPVFGTIASQFNDAGMNSLYLAICDRLRKAGGPFESSLALDTQRERTLSVLPADRVRYLAEIAETSDRYDKGVKTDAAHARAAYRLYGTINLLRGVKEDASVLIPEVLDLPGDSPSVRELVERYHREVDAMTTEAKKLLRRFPEERARLSGDVFRYDVRGRTIELPLTWSSLSGTKVRKVALPSFTDWGDLLEWLMTENVPGSFPFAAGVFPLKRDGEDPARMFAGEGGAERTNKRFHYVSRGMAAKRLSTAFDSVTLYGEDPDHRPDIFGKIGNSGVSIANVDDAKKLYSGFDLADPSTSVSMTINGPAPMLLAFFMNAAIDQACEKHIRAQGRVAQVTDTIETHYRDRGLERPRYRGSLPEGNDGLGLLLLGVSGEDVLTRDEYEAIKKDTLSRVRGTVQADILKEDQAQNTCIFSTEFALRMMGDIQDYFIRKQVRNFYSVSISGYHIAEAGANPITQLAFTLANGFTYVEYYLARGMNIDDFAPNLSFFFSNGLDPEYSVIGRVARRLWAKAMRNKYGANERSQKLKYHIQTSGRSLHAQEIAFNDIRTTLQALYAIYDNCNSLHTNAYDEAITTPTEESVRRALAIQLVINEELGLSRNENPLQGSFIIDELTQLVEQAVLHEFRSINERGGVLGAMERMYQRTKIQEESLLYETKKHTGELPIIGVNTFLSSEGSPTILPKEVIRSTREEREMAIEARDAFRKRNEGRTGPALDALERTAMENGNLFEALMEVSKVATLGQISSRLYQVGGQYRRNM